MAILDPITETRRGQSAGLHPPFLRGSPFACHGPQIACSYFPFVYPYYEENTSNFGMLDRRATPLRSLASYAQLIRVLARHRYLGDLRHSAPRAPQNQALR
jgi:hypothetical protein